MEQTAINKIIKKAILFLRRNNTIKRLASTVDDLEIDEKGREIKLYVGMCSSEDECSYDGYERLMITFRSYGDVYKNTNDLIFSPFTGGALKIEHFIFSINKHGPVLFLIPITSSSNLTLCDGDKIVSMAGTISFNKNQFKLLDELNNGENGNERDH